MARRRIVKTVFASLALIAAVVGGLAWKALYIQEIPEELDAMDTQWQVGDLTYEGMGVADLTLANLRGKTTFLWVEGQASIRSDEAKELKLALNRWVFPESTVGYMVADATGFGLFKAKARPFIQGLQGDMARFPLYPDWEGAILDMFKLPKGHTAIVVLGSDGRVRLRHSGAVDPAKLDEIQRLLGASEPPSGSPAPTFRVGDLSNEACSGKHCIVAFLGQPIARTDVPGVEGGRELTEAEKKDGGVMKIMRNPALRLVMSLQIDIPDKIAAVVAGEVTGLDEEIGEGWSLTPNTPGLREPFGVATSQTAFFIVGPEGNLVFEETGDFPLYRVAQIGEILEIDFKPRHRGRREGDTR